MNCRVLLLATCVTALAAAGQAASFVQRRGAQLYIDDRPWYFIGANAYWLMDTAKGNNPKIDRFFKTCADTGLTVVRLWGFNHNSPSAKGVYDESEMNNFDYIVYSAGQHNIRLIFALGNTWTAYRSPEDFMTMAGDNPSGKTLLDFYQSQPTKDMFKSHIQYFVTRKNTYNGVMYRDDPAIMMWDVFNEPRCPGCTDASQQQVVLSWMQEMASYLKTYAPNQLVAAGTEGYFMDDSNVRYNPGAGAYCEGEDWVAINKLSGLDCTTAHVYDRQMESIPPSWRQPSFNDLLNWIQKYLEAHASASTAVGKPMIVEEFNVLSNKFSESERAQVFQLLYDFLGFQRSSGGPLSGVMFWNAAVGGDVWDDGYNVYLDTTPDVISSTPSPTPSHTSSFSNSPRSPAASAPVILVPGGPGRKPIYSNTEGLDSFRRGPERATCAESIAKWWTPIWVDSQVDVSSLQTRTQGKTTLDIIKQMNGLLTIA